MDCPECGNASRVLDSRAVEGRVYRRRICKTCEFRFSTYEAYDETNSRPTLPNAKAKKKMDINQQAQAVVSRIKMPVPPAPQNMTLTRVPAERTPLTVKGSSGRRMTDEQLERAQRVRDFLNSRGEDDDE